jgi:hypothetical protein
MDFSDWFSYNSSILTDEKFKHLGNNGKISRGTNEKK